MSDFVPWLRELADKGGTGVVNAVDARSLGRIADEIERLRAERRNCPPVSESEYVRRLEDEIIKRETPKQNPYAILGTALVTAVTAGARAQIEANPADLPNRLQEYAFYRMENASDAGDALLVNDLLAAAKLLRRSNSR